MFSFYASVGAVCVVMWAVIFGMIFVLKKKKRVTFGTFIFRLIFSVLITAGIALVVREVLPNYNIYVPLLYDGIKYGIN